MKLFLTKSFDFLQLFMNYPLVIKYFPKYSIEKDSSLVKQQEIQNSHLVLFTNHKEFIKHDFRNA